MKKASFYLVMLLAVLACLELCSYLGIRYLARVGAFYLPPTVSAEEYASYLRDRDPVLGWPFPKHPEMGLNKDKEHIDKTGSRLIPAFPDPDKDPACVSLYGDSFTWGDEVDDQSAWSNVLSQLLHCRVANYGFKGYGTDQAYLRFHLHRQDHAKIVILGFLSENIIRNINQYRGLELGTKYRFKPRFILDDQGQLQLIPLPAFTYRQLTELLQTPDKYLPYEYFVPGGGAGIYRVKFPYTVTLIKGLLGNYVIRAKFKDEPLFTSFYRLDHPSRAIFLAAAIMKKFSREAIARGQKPIVLIIPTGSDLLYFQKHRVWVYANLLKMLKDAKIDLIDAGPEIMQYLQDRNPAELFYDVRAHFNVKGNEVLAKIVFAHIRGQVCQALPEPRFEIGENLINSGKPKARQVRDIPCRAAGG